MTKHEIFTACFPELSLSWEQVRRCTDMDNGTVFAEDGGFAVVSGERITLIAVAPNHRRCGIGSRLLSLCEEHIHRNGGKRAELGGGLFSGAIRGSYEFFESHGYCLGEEFADMGIGLADYSDPLPESKAEFRIFDGDEEDLRRAVALVDEEWVQYFHGGEYFCGYVDGKLVSFCILDEDVECVVSYNGGRTGSVGCVGTIPAARGQGTGLKMVSLAMELLRERGCTNCFIHYTHLEKWYGRLGIKTKVYFRRSS